MTVAADLATAVGVHRRLFLKIDGVKQVLWQTGEHVGPDGKPVPHDAPPGAHPLLPGTLALWRFDEQLASANGVDETGNYTAVATGSPPIYTVAPQIGLGARGPFSGSNYFLATIDDRFKVNRVTLAAWIYVNSTSQTSGATIIASHTANTGIALICLSADSKVSFSSRATDATNLDAVAPTALSVGWHHVCGTWDGTTSRTYHDGVEVASTTPAAGKVIDWGAATQMGIGNSLPAATNEWNGLIDDLVVYPFAVSAEWVRRRYTGGRDYDREALACLRAPSEASLGFSPGKFEVQQSGMTFELENIDDPTDPGKSFFGKLFAPGRYQASGAAVTWLRRPSATATQLEATATTIYTNNNDDFPASGVAFVAGEAFLYTGKSTAAGPNGDTLDTFTGVTKGLWPAVGATYGADRFGRAYLYPPLGTDNLESDQANRVSVSEHPFALTGKRVALYVTTWDRENNDWHAFDDAELLWVGNVSDKIVFKPRENVWQLSCQGVLDWLRKRTVGAEGSETKLAQRINLQGPSGLTFVVSVRPTGSSTQTVATITVPTGLYLEPFSLVGAIISELNDASNWPSGAPSFFRFLIEFNRETGLFEFGAINGAGNGDRVVKISVAQKCTALAALGFGVSEVDDEKNTYRMAYGYRNEVVIEDGKKGTFSADLPAFSSFWSSASSENGAKAYFTGSATQLVTQGDHDTSRGYFSIGKRVYIFTTTTAASGDTPAYATMADQFFAYVNPTEDSLVIAHGSAPGKDIADIKQAYTIDGSQNDFGKFDPDLRGPLEMLLYGLLSTGSGTNGSYDKLPLRLARIGLPQAIVDTQSFIDIDKALIAGRPQIAERTGYVVAKPTSWIEMWEREAKLFSLILAWDRGKIRAKAISGHDVQVRGADLDDGTNAQVNEWVPVESSTENVVNEWEVKFQYDLQEDKFLETLSVVDVESVNQTGVNKVLKIEHPGLFQRADGDIHKELVANFYGASDVNRFPWYKVNVTLAPTLANLLALGDVVKYTSSYLPDPFGSGSMSSTLYGVVTDLSWDYRSWTGRATIYLNSDYDQELKVPFGGSALVDIWAASGGWDSANNRLTLVSHQYTDDTDANEDGYRFVAGDKVIVRERDAFGAVAAAVSATVASNYETDGANILTLDAVTLSVDATRQFVVVPDVYGTAVAAQQDDNAYLASGSTQKLDSTDTPHRYG